MAILTVQHLTHYRYRRPVALGEHHMMFRPRESYDQRLLETRLKITPEPAEIRYYHDVFGNTVGIAPLLGPRQGTDLRELQSPEHLPDNTLDDPAAAERALRLEEGQRSPSSTTCRTC